MLVKKNIVTKALGVVPDHIKMKAGEKAYEGFIALRRKILDAELKEAYIEPDRPISYLEIDRGKDETILFLHGFADSKDTFYDAAQFLIGDFNLVIPDLPGFGKSFKKKGERYTLENYGRWIVEFLNEINLTGFHLAGNSLGGAVAAQVAIMVPDRLKTLTLVDPAAVHLREPYSLHHELIDGHIMFDVQNRDEFEYFLNRVFVKQPLMPHPIKDFIYKEFSRHCLWHRKLLTDLFDGLDSEDDPRLNDIALNDRLHKITCPTLILWGDEDSLFPKETAYVIKQEIKNSEIHFLMDVGHAPQIEVPRRFSNVLKKFVQQQCIIFDAKEKQRLHDLGTNVAQGYEIKLVENSQEGGGKKTVAEHSSKKAKKAATPNKKPRVTKAKKSPRNKATKAKPKRASGQAVRKKKTRAAQSS